jgi:hypothetical protein
MAMFRTWERNGPIKFVGPFLSQDQLYFLERNVNVVILRKETSKLDRFPRRQLLVLVEVLGTALLRLSLGEVLGPVLGEVLGEVNFILKPCLM